MARLRFRSPTWRGALAVWEYAEHSARYIFGDALGDPLADEILAAIPASEKLRQTWAALAPSQHKTHYVTPPQSGKPRKWPPDTRGMVFEKLILGQQAL